MPETEKSNPNDSTKLVSLSNKELDSWIARIICDWYLTPKIAFKCDYGEIDYMSVRWSPCALLDHAHIAEEELKGRFGLQAWGEYCQNLLKVVCKTQVGEAITVTQAFECFSATARQKAEAMYFTFPSLQKFKGFD